MIQTNITVNKLLTMNCHHNTNGLPALLFSCNSHHTSRQDSLLAQTIQASLPAVSPVPLQTQASSNAHQIMQHPVLHGAAAAAAVPDEANERWPLLTC
jgi:Leucine-rich repeat (LRR) protein